MGLRFLTDQCVSEAVVYMLRDTGNEVLRLRDYSHPDIADHQLIARAQGLNCILLTLDRYFTDIVTYPPAAYKGIIALQIKNRPELLSGIVARLRDHIHVRSDMADYAHKLFIIESYRIRIYE
jgi:predicted nuclease of predicted toxin-antitoxin system